MWGSFKTIFARKEVKSEQVESEIYSENMKFFIDFDSEKVGKVVGWSINYLTNQFILRKLVDRSDWPIG